MQPGESVAPEHPAGAPNGAAEWVTISEAARRVGVNKSTVSRQVERLGVAKDDQGRIDLNDYLAKRGGDLNPLMARGEAAPAAAGAPKARRGSGLTSAATELKQLQAKDLQIRIAEKEGQLIERERVASAIFSLVRTYRDVLMAIPQRHAAELAATADPGEVQKLMEAAMRKALDDLADQLKQIAAADKESLQ